MSVHKAGVVLAVIGVTLISYLVVVGVGSSQGPPHPFNGRPNEAVTAISASKAIQTARVLRIQHIRAIRRYRAEQKKLAEQRAAEAALAQATPSPQYASSGSSSGSADTSGLPNCTWGPESGGNYNASNPSGAYGKYQIMPQTAADNGCDLSTPGGQDACAVKIWDGGKGAGNWVNC